MSDRRGLTITELVERCTVPDITAAQLERVLVESAKAGVAEKLADGRWVLAPWWEEHLRTAFSAIEPEPQPEKKPVVPKMETRNLKEVPDHSGPKPTLVQSPPAATPRAAENATATLERLLTARELADVLGFSASTLLDWHEAGKIPSLRVGRAVRFRESEVAEWLEARRR